MDGSCGWASGVGVVGGIVKKDFRGWVSGADSGGGGWGEG